MRFEWDERKNRLNEKKHGIAFGLAARVFGDECRILEKDRDDGETGEQRWHANWQDWECRNLRCGPCLQGGERWRRNNPHHLGAGR